MSKYFCMELIDAVIDQQFTTGKASNLEHIRVRFLKVGTPPGTMKLQILNETKTTVLAESNTISCNYTTDPNYVGTDDVGNMSWIRFDFNGEAVRESTIYHARLVADSAYVTGRSSSNYLMAILDYPKPTNDQTDIETTYGRNFAKYPVMVLQFFGRDYGENA